MFSAAPGRTQTHLAPGQGQGVDGTSSIGCGVRHLGSSPEAVDAMVRSNVISCTPEHGGADRATFSSEIQTGTAYSPWYVVR